MQRSVELRLGASHAPCSWEMSPKGWPWELQNQRCFMLGQRGAGRCCVLGCWEGQAQPLEWGFSFSLFWQISLGFLPPQPWAGPPGWCRCSPSSEAFEW